MSLSTDSLVDRFAPALNVVPLVLLTIGWQVMAMWIDKPLLLPTVPMIAEELVKITVVTGSVYPHLAATLFRVVVGFAGAMVVGIPLGLMMGRSDLVEYIVDPIIAFGYPAPRIALFPVFLVIFGLGHEAKIAIVFLECLIPLTLGAYYGADSVSRDFIWSGKNLGADDSRIFREVVLPASLPYIFSGIRTAFPIALLAVVVTEMISASQGIGYVIVSAIGSFAPSQLFAGVLLVAAFGLVGDYVLGSLRDRALFWAEDVGIEM